MFLLRAWIPANQIRGCVFFRAPRFHLGTVDGTWGNGETENYKYSRFPAFFLCLCPGRVVGWS